MRIAIASGKGGTGKTTLATSLAFSAEGAVRLLDCDVEEPNCHIFARPQIDITKPVTVPVPHVDESRCTACGKCGEACQFNAIVSLNTKPLVFPEICHGCGGCSMVCPEEAISEKEREIGVLAWGRAEDVEFAHGLLNVGEAMSPPLIRAVKRRAHNGCLNVIDAPPGTSCPAVEAIKGVDYVVLVTEPTPFGLHDLKLAAETVRKLGLPFGVVVNRADIGDSRVCDYCGDEGIPVLLEIPDDRRVAEAYSRGHLLIEALPEYRARLRGLVRRIEAELPA